MYCLGEESVPRNVHCTSFLPLRVKMQMRQCKTGTVGFPTVAARVQPYGMDTRGAFHSFLALVGVTWYWLADKHAFVLQ